MSKSKHLAQLKEMGYVGSTLGQINNLERYAHQQAEFYANGEISETELDNQLASINTKVKELFGGEMPNGFFINLDPRGYALKLSSDADAPVTYTDWGGFKILAPEFERG